MTAIDIQYANHVENKRANRAREDLTQFSNVTDRLNYLEAQKQNAAQRDLWETQKGKNNAEALRTRVNAAYDTVSRPIDMYATVANTFSNAVRAVGSLIPKG